MAGVGYRRRTDTRLSHLRVVCARRLAVLGRTGRRNASKTLETLQVFVNTVLGEVWKDESALPLDADAL